MKAIVADVYNTYKGDDEPHKLRLSAAFFTSVLISVVGGDFSAAAFPAMALTVSVLAGFTFTALFSGHLLTTNELPEPRDENDRQDLARLKRLAVNFRARSRFFLVISILVLVVIILLSVPLDTAVKSAIAELLDHGAFEQLTFWVSLVREVPNVLFAVMVSIVFFVFFESIYTFYRLSETALAITDTRRDYIDARS